MEGARPPSTSSSPSSLMASTAAVAGAAVVAAAGTGVSDGGNVGTSTSSSSGSHSKTTLIMVAVAGFILTCIVALPYLACLLTRPVSRIRRMYLATTSMPLVFAVSALATCLAPSSEDFWTLLQHLAEAWALHSLNKLIVERLGGQAQTIARIRRAGKGQRAQYLRTPPLCCCLTCLPYTEFDARILQLVLALTRQFMLVVPVISVVGIALSYNTNLGRDALVWQLLRLLLLGSSLLALWGLFILWKATLTDQSARHARISLKFVAIKLLIIVGVVQEYAFSQAAAGKKDEEDHWAVLLPNALLACESPFLTVLMLLAFPLSELEAPPPPPLSASSINEPGASSPLLQSPLSPPVRAGGGTAGEGGGGEEEEEEMGVGDLLFTRRGESLGGMEKGVGSAAAAAAAVARVPSSTEYII